MPSSFSVILFTGTRLRANFAPVPARGKKEKERREERERERRGGKLFGNAAGFHDDSLLRDFRENFP